MTHRRWFGQRFPVLIDSSESIGPIELIQTLSLNIPAIHSGDTVVRTLFAWGVESGIIDNSSGVDRVPVPCSVKLAYFPVPDGDPSGDPQDPGGDALHFETLAPDRNYWSDGTLFGTKFTAWSRGMRDGQAQRFIHDKTVAELSLGIGFDVDTIPGADSLPITYEGWIEIRFLVQSIFG